MVHGCGVRTPIAAAVAAATCGFAIDEHIPKGGILLPAATSVIVAIGFEPPRHVACDVAFNTDGDAPNGHINCAPLTTTTPMFFPPFQWHYIFYNDCPSN
jgi:hypothetical protein